MTRWVRWIAVVCLAVPLGAPAAEESDSVTFEGNEQVTREQLLRALRRYSVSLGPNFGKTDADDAAYFLREFYFTRGFREADVSYTYQSPPPSAVFKIFEGGIVLIRDVEFVGTSAIDPDTLRSIFDSAVRQSTLNPFGQMRYVASGVEAGRSSIESALNRMGYLTARVAVLAADPSEGEVDLTIRIDEGVQSVMRQIEILGIEGVGLNDLVASLVDEPFRFNEEALIAARVETYLHNQGYFKATANAHATVNLESGDVDVVVTVDPKGVYRIGKISVAGNDKTLAGAVRRRFGVRSGDLYDASVVDQGARRLWFSGAFAEADVRRVPNPDGTVDLEIELKEAAAREIRLTVGYNEWEQVFGKAKYLDRNFLGTLNQFSVDGFISQRGGGGSIGLASPWIFSVDATASIAAFFARIEQPAYRTTEFGTKLGFERRFSDTTSTGYRVEYVWKRTVDSEALGEDENLADPDFTYGGLLFGQRYDTRNDVLAPMKGSLLRWEGEVVSPALLGDLSFVRLEGGLTHYFPLREITEKRPFVPFFIVNHRAGVLVPYGDSDVVPVQERFYLGGPNTVRSFQLDGMGPRDSQGIPLGGLAMFLLNLEFQWPAFNNLYVAAFMDAGNLAPTVEELTFDDTQVGVGPGVRFYTPIGAIRVDYGYNLNRQEGDPVGAWQFGLGFTF